MITEETIKEADTIFRDGMFKLAGMYVNNFNKKPEDTLRMFCNTSVPIEVMTTVYKWLVHEKDIVKIEDLPQDTKAKLWTQARVSCPGGTKEKCIKLCCVIWLMNFINEN